ncbi:MAG TPA: T9SS type A sorting domain-containing protein, partial [Flavobacteriales bacterium]
GCAAFSTTATVNITAAPSATISYASPLCASSTSATVTRTGTAGGTYTAPAAVSINAGTGTINPSLSTIGGPYTITYTVAAANGCAAFSTTASVTISAAPSAAISYGSPLCSSSTSATVTRTGTSGGTYTAPAAVSINASTGTINPSLSTVGGPYTITYTVAPSGDCAGFSTTASVTITAAPSATISYAGSPYCSTVGSSAVTRTGTSGGTYSSTTGLTLDANTGAIDPSTSTAGTYTVTYTIAASGGCAAFSTTATVTITAAPTATISYTSPVCSNGSSAAVTRTGTAGGTYTAPAAVSINASTGEINVASSTPGGPYTITYTVAASGGCAAFSTTASITITAAPAASISYSGSPFCTAAVGTVSVTRTGTSGGSYSSTAGLTINASTGAITPSSSAAGTYTVTYTVAASGGCTAFSTTASVTIDQATTWYADADGDGFGDPAVSQQACTQPVGHVSNNSDSCPLVEGIVGSSCDDEDPLTTGDALNAQCECVGSLVDCDDEDPCTSDSFNGVACVNTPLPDSDTDGTCDLIDGCPNDPNKIAPGVCGCGTADVDSDTDGTLDCNDGCPNDPNKTAPGACGCGVADVATTYYADTDGDGFGDPASSEAGFTCSVPQGFVANNTDNCPTTFGRIGDACDDLDAETINDVIGQDCVCRGTDMPEVDCEGVPNGPAMPGTACDDEDATTYDDVYAVDCECVGTPYDCPVLLANIGDACDDLDQMTQDDTINANCECVGTPIVVYDCPELEANIGDACDDDNAMTEDDTINGNCVCVGTPIVVYECPELEANIGDACDDDNAMTEDDTVNAQCECVGTPIIVWDCPVLEANIGDACNDNDATTEDDMVNAQCVCAGTSIYDCPTLQANIGDACDDGVVGTVDDVVNANCVCAGVPTGCTENLNLAITLDAFGSQTTWQLVNDASTVVASGGPYNNGAAGTVVNAPICVPQGCYHLRVSDSNGNGITNGGYVLTDASNRRIIDASKGSFSTNSEILLGGAPMNVCVPLSNNGMLAGTCDLPSRRINLPVYASSGGPNATQYQFWIFDPHGTYSRRLVTASPQFTPGDQQTNPIPLNKDLNICVRVMIGGEYRPFGPVCRYRFVPATSTPGAPSSLMLDGLSADLYPNPNRTGVVNLNLQGLSKSGLPVAIDIYDALGKVVYNEQVPGTESTFNHVLDLSGDLRAGMYLVNITVDGQRLTKRLILE